MTLPPSLVASIAFCTRWPITCSSRSSCAAAVTPVRGPCSIGAIERSLWRHRHVRTTASRSTGRAFSTGVAPVRNCNISLFMRSDDILDCRQHVTLKFRVVAMPLGVAQHQRELRDQVLQIVHDKGGHAIEGFEFARFQQRFGGAKLTEIARRLPARGLEQIAHFPVDFDLRARRRQHNESEQAGTRRQRNDQPRVADRRKPCWQFQVG